MRFHFCGNKFPAWIRILLYTVIINSIINECNGQKSNPIPFLYKNGKYGFVDSSTMKALNNVAFDWCSPFYTKTAIVQLGDSFALISNTLEYTSKTYYDKIIPVSEFADFYFTNKNNKWGIVSNTGTIISECLFDTCLYNSRDYKIGRYIVGIKDGKSTIFNYDGQIVTSGVYDFYYGRDTLGSNIYIGSDNLDFDDSLIKVKLGNKYGLIDQKGKIVLQCKYKQIDTIIGLNRYAKVYMNGQCGLINKKGQVVISCSYLNITLYNDSDIFCVEKSIYDNKTKSYISKWGVIDSIENTKIPFVYDRLDLDKTIKYNLARIGNNYFFIDINGNKVSDNYVDAYPFNKGWARVKINNQWKEINEKWIIRNAMSDVQKLNGQPFVSPKTNLFYKHINGKIGLANSSGKIIISPEYDEIIADLFEYGTIILKQHYKYSFASLNGIKYINQSFDNYFINRKSIILASNNKYGIFAIENGNIVQKLPCNFAWIAKINNENWFVMEGWDKTGYYGQNNNYIIPISKTNKGYFPSSGIFFDSDLISGKMFYIDRTGKQYKEN